MHQSIPAAPIPPPGQLRGICVPCQCRGWGISKFGTARGSGISCPRAFDTHVVSDSKSKHGGFYRKGPAVRRRLDRPLRTGQACGGFLDFMHFFIAYQGTTITLYSEIGNDQRELAYACFFEQGFKQNLVYLRLNRQIGMTYKNRFRTTLICVANVLLTWPSIHWTLWKIN